MWIKAQLSQWKSRSSPKLETARQSRSNVNVMLTMFLDYNGSVHHEFLRKGQIINHFYYYLILRRLCESVGRDLNFGVMVNDEDVHAHLVLLIRPLSRYTVEEKTKILE